VRRGPTNRVSQRRECVSSRIGRHWPGVAALIVGLQRTYELEAFPDPPPIRAGLDSACIFRNRRAGPCCFHPFCECLQQENPVRPSGAKEHRRTGALGISRRGDCNHLYSRLAAAEAEVGMLAGLAHLRGYLDSLGLRVRGT
jgi:hypothetical protein